MNQPPILDSELHRTFESIKKAELGERSTSQSIYNNDLLTKELKTFTYQDFINLEFPPNSWLVDKLIPVNGISCISGQPKVGKSLVALNLAVSVATGNKLFGHFELEQSNVLYISKDEPANLTQSRLKKMVNGIGSDIPIFFITDSELSLEPDGYIRQLTNIIKDHQIKVVIIDSFRRIFKGDENSSQVINDVQKRLKQLQENDVTIIFIHHHGKEGFFKRNSGDKLRGSSDILAMLDSLILIEKAGDEKFKLTQGVLRADKAMDPFIVQMNTLDHSLLKFEFVDFIEPEEEKKEQAKQDILRLLSEINEEFNQKEIIKRLKPEADYGETTIKNALKDLELTKQIMVTSKGNQKIYQLLKSDK